MQSVWVIRRGPHLRFLHNSQQVPDKNSFTFKMCCHEATAASQWSADKRTEKHPLFQSKTSAWPWDQMNYSKCHLIYSSSMLFNVNALEWWLERGGGVHHGTLQGTNNHLHLCSINGWPINKILHVVLDGGGNQMTKKTLSSSRCCFSVC